MTKKHSSVAAVYPLLAEIGFKKRAGDVFTLDLEPGVLGVLGLNRATRGRPPGEVKINPVVGVRFQEVERLVAECRGEQFHSYRPSTISTPLGYVMPEKRFKGWVFSPAQYNEVATDMVDAIAAYGVAFMRSVVDLDGLRRWLRDSRGLHEHQILYRRPAAALVAGDVEEARALVDEEVKALGERTDLAAVEFRNFAEAFRHRLR